MWAGRRWRRSRHASTRRGRENAVHLGDGRRVRPGRRARTTMLDGESAAAIRSVSRRRRGGREEGASGTLATPRHRILPCGVVIHRASRLRCRVRRGGR